MKARIFFAISLCCLLHNTHAQTSACIDSSTRFLLQSNNSRILIRDNEVLADSSVIITGNIWETNQPEYYLFISKLDKNNNIIFSKKLNGFTGFARKIIECNNGDILIAAITYNNTFQVPWLFRFTSNGNLIWQKQIDTPSSFTSVGGTLTVYENNNGNIYLGMTESKETDPANGIISGYYYIYKLNSSGSSIWKTTLIQIENTLNYINAIKEENGILSFITQQYFVSNTSCTATDFKSVGLLRLHDNNGSFIDSKVYCLNFFGSGCLSAQTSVRHSAAFLSDGRIIISGMVYPCDHRLFTLETDQQFNVINCYSYKYIVPYGISNGVSFVNRFGQVSLYSRGYDGSNFLYATFNPDGTIVRQRKLQLPAGTSNSVGNVGFAFRKPDRFLVFSNFTQNSNEVLQVMEFKGNNNGTADCTGKDTTFMSSEPHTVIPIAFNLDTIRSGIFTPVNSSFTLSDFTFQRIEVCSSVSICDSLKINGNSSFCLNNPQQNFIALRNPGCNKVPEWRIDTSAIFYLTALNDTAVQIKFKRPWEGYLYAFSNSCGNLLDSFYIKVFSSADSINIGRDTTFCNSVILDAGSNFINYQWQDNSSNRFYTVSAPGRYYVTATDNCGTTFMDSVIYSPKKEAVFLGNDTCISNFPYLLKVSTGYSRYQWKDGSSNPESLITEPGLYYVTVRNYCNEVYSDSIRIYKTIKSFSLGADNFICPGKTIQLHAPSGYSIYQWHDQTGDSLFQVTAAGVYYVTVTDFCGNKYSDTINITPLGKNVSLGADISICKNEKIQLSAKGSFETYTWSPNYNINSISSQSVIVNPEITTDYTVKAFTTGGCEAMDTITITVNDCPQNFFVPTAFTPNNDGRNDLFKPMATAPLEKYEFSIYNRWGQRIYYSTNILTGWNGELAGVKQNTGSYVWICTYKFYNQPAIFRKGTFTLIR